jgi:hypothetical protein
MVIFRCLDYIPPRSNKCSSTTRQITPYYPIGLLLCQPQNSFLSFVLDKCLQYYDDTQYQSIGARMFDKLFPTENEIFNIDDSIKICNEDYYLPWAWNEVGEFLEKKDNILPSNNVGIHWFNGDLQSKQYAIDLEKRLDNFKIECYLDKIIDKYIELPKSVRFDSNYNIGLCFKTYVNEHTPTERYRIISEFVDSLSLLVDNYDNLTIIGIVDCKLTPKLKKCFKKINNKIKIIILNENKGISFATNVGIEFLLNHNCDYIFCCDDDIIIKDKNVLTVYINSMINNNIRHLAYYPRHIYPTYCEAASQNLSVTPNGFSGCFYCFTKDCIYNDGYLPMLDGKFGFEHEIFTKKITTRQYDIVNSDNYVKTAPESILYKSFQNEISTISKSNLEKYVDDNYWKEQVDYTILENGGLK